MRQRFRLMCACAYPAQKLCNFLEWREYKIVYKRYASLFFITCGALPSLSLLGYPYRHGPSSRTRPAPLSRGASCLVAAQTPLRLANPNPSLSSPTQCIQRHLWVLPRLVPTLPRAWGGASSHSRPRDKGPARKEGGGADPRNFGGLQWTKTTTS